MFGLNKRYSKGFVEAPNLVVHSVFATIQGEGIYAGVPAIFIRMAHCNLACTFCDTDFDSGQKVSPQYLLEWVRTVIAEAKIKPQVLVITGGEPLLQDFSEFARLFYAQFKIQIQVETAGTVWQENLSELCIMGHIDIICSPKTPSIHPQVALNTNAYKYIVREGWVSSDDGLPEVPTQPGLSKRTKLARPPITTRKLDIYVQPVDEQDAEQNQKNLEFAAKLAMQHGYTLSVQIHKIIGLE